MKRRGLLRLMALLGFLAVVGQLAAYAILAKNDPAGTSMRRYTTTLDGWNFTLGYPNTWKVTSELHGASSTITCIGPTGQRIEYSSIPLLAVKKDLAQMDKDPLPDIHGNLSERTSLQFDEYSEEQPEVASSLPFSGYFSLFSAEKHGKAYRGVRYTTTSPDLVWIIVAVCPADQWQRSRKSISGIIDSWGLTQQ